MYIDRCQRRACQVKLASGATEAERLMGFPPWESASSAVSMSSVKRKQDEVSLRPSKKAKPDNAAGSDANADIQEPDPSTSGAFDLPALLDLSSLHDESAISDRFDEIARVLIHGYHLVVSREQVETAFQIQEVEFYLQKAKCHEDPFTHGTEEQKVSGRWCVCLLMDSRSSHSEIVNF